MANCLPLLLVMAPRRDMGEDSRQYSRIGAKAAGRHPEPSGAVVDSQSVQTTEQGGIRGYDAGKKISGRKRHVLVDTLGLVLLVVIVRNQGKSLNMAEMEMFRVVEEKLAEQWLLNDIWHAHAQLGLFDPDHWRESICGTQNADSPM